jgi:hypothetical protein
VKKHKPWFNEGCSKLLDQRKKAKLQWLQYPSEINGDNLNNAKREASRHFRNKKREYLKDKMNELAMNNKNKNIRDLYRGINELKKGYQTRNNSGNDENGDLLEELHNILNRWKNYCILSAGAWIIHTHRKQKGKSKPMNGPQLHSSSSVSLRSVL